MLSIVTGGSGSGKSFYAEQLIASYGDYHRYYIATMENRDEESDKRIQRHRLMRADKHFETIECPRDLDKITLSKKSVILLECMSNLAANEMFADGKLHDPYQMEQKIIKGVTSICAQADHVVIVTNEVFSDSITYDLWTRDYLKCLGRINTRMAAMADRVVEVVYSIPLVIKGE